MQRLGYLVGRCAGRYGLKDAVIDSPRELLALLAGKATVELLDTAGGADTTQQLGESAAHATAVSSHNTAQTPTAQTPTAQTPTAHETAATPSTALW